MNLTLKRTDFREDGIFGVLLDEVGQQIAVTLERAYDSGNGDGSYAPKVKPGTYTCVRGMHRLAVNKPQFETFEIKGVAGHWGILFHAGNYNKDSQGCVLLGDSFGGDPRMIYNSRVTFAKFMDLQYGLDEFKLEVV